MQYCTKCKNIVEDKIAVCPYCKRTKSLRQAKAGDSVFIMKTTQFEAGELSYAFEQAAIKHAVVPFSMGVVSSIYDSEIMPTDKNLFVNFEDLERAKELMAKEYEEEVPLLEEEQKPMGKQIAVQIICVIVFLTLTALVVLSTDFIANFIKNLFI